MEEIKQQKEKINELWLKMDRNTNARNIVGVRILSADILKAMNILNQLKNKSHERNKI